MISFKGYLESECLDEDSSIGDFAKDVHEDNNFPLCYKPSLIENYLGSKLASPECIETFREAWNKYVRYVLEEEGTLSVYEKILDEIQNAFLCGLIQK